MLQYEVLAFVDAMMPSGYSDLVSSLLNFLSPASITQQVLDIQTVASLAPMACATKIPSPVLQRVLQT